MCPQPIVAVTMDALEDCLLDRPVHPLDLTFRSRMVGLRQAMFDPARLADQVEARRPGAVGVPVPGPLGELGCCRSVCARDHRAG